MSYKPNSKPVALSRWSDGQWWLALLAAPLFWMLLASGGVPLVGPDWISVQPGVFIMLALVYPVLEEIVFRGLIQDGLAKRLQPWRFSLFSKANLLTSVAFTALHFVQHPPMWAAGVFLPSLLYGHFRERHLGLFSPILLHAFYNGGYFALFGAIS